MKKNKEKTYLKANYHTHTYRCGHAEGDEREYAAQALAAGLRILGFSDHTPQDYFDSEPRDRPIRMKPKELPGYADSVRSLAEEYRGRLEIHLGVETEYYPKYFSRLIDMLRCNGVEYMILGQHFLGNEIDEPYSGCETEDVALLERYVSQTSEALDTGLFTYFAHPDLIHYTGDPTIYEREMRRLCRAAAKRGTVLELNLLGLRESRHYPSERFWRIAAEEGCHAILGFDAHNPRQLTSTDCLDEAFSLAERTGIELIKELPLVRI